MISCNLNSLKAEQWLKGQFHSKIIPYLHHESTEETDHSLRATFDKIIKDANLRFDLFITLSEIIVQPPNKKLIGYMDEDIVLTLEWR